MKRKLGYLLGVVSLYIVTSLFTMSFIRAKYVPFIQCLFIIILFLPWFIPKLSKLISLDDGRENTENN